MSDLLGSLLMAAIIGTGAYGVIRIGLAIHDHLWWRETKRQWKRLQQEAGLE